MFLKIKYIHTYIHSEDGEEDDDELPCVIGESEVSVV